MKRLISASLDCQVEIDVGADWRRLLEKPSVHRLSMDCAGVLASIRLLG
jgi:hypothetical protein